MLEKLMTIFSVKPTGFASALLEIGKNLDQ
jgi:hypothetical protein